MELRPTVFFLLAAAGSALAHAGDFYILGAAGQSGYKLDRAEFDGSLRRAGATGLSSTTDESDTGYKLQFGYRFAPNVALEGGYVDLGKARYTAVFLGGVAEASVKAHGANLALLGILPINGAFSAFAKIGAINAKAETSLRTSRFNVSVNNTYLRFNDGIGLEWNVGNHIGARLEYEQFHKLGDLRGGMRRVDFWSVGLAVRF